MGSPNYRRPDPGFQPGSLRLEIAAVAAQLIADAGLDYRSAKRKAARQVLGDGTVPRGALPDNDQIDEALREHLDLFDDGHEARVDRMRRVALDLMRALGQFQPYLTGAVWKGIVSEHAPIHVQVFHDDPKAVPIHLLNLGIDYDVTEMPHFRSDGGRPDVEALTMFWRNEPVLLSLYGSDDLRGALRGEPADRGDAQAVARLLTT